LFKLFFLVIFDGVYGFFSQTDVIGHCKTTDRPVKRQTENEKKSQRFDKIKRGAIQHNSRHTDAPHLHLPQRTSKSTNECKY
ncbi:hypothetical protein, partial [Flavobacterium psychrophilum]